MAREDALERIRGKHISTFDLIADDEYEAGLARAERELRRESTTARVADVVGVVR